MRKITFSLCLCLLATGVLLLPAQAAPTAQAATEALRSALKSRISSPGGNLVIKITPGARASQGYFQEVYISAKPAQIKRRRFSELAMRARNVRLSMPHLMKGKIET